MKNTKKITTVSVVLYKNFMAIYIQFSLDFLGLDNVDFENYFANEFIKIGRRFVVLLYQI